jgi:predicted MFS family arabinose efflux permease
MVGREDLMNAVALNSLLFNVARAVGPALGGLLLIWIGPALCFLANGLSYLAVVAALLRMHSGRRRIVAQSPMVPVNRRSWLRIEALAGSHRLVVLILLAGVMAMCGWPVVSLLPAIAQRQLGLAVQGFSVMLCGIGLGALTAALAVARFGSMDRTRLFIGIGLCVVPAGLMGLSVVSGLPLAVACCALIGFGLILFLATGQSVVQLSAGDHNRGRIMGTWAMVLSGAVPLGNLLAGLAADRWGVSLVLHLQGLTCSAAALMLLTLYWLWRRSSGRVVTSAEQSARESDAQAR